MDWQRSMTDTADAFTILHVALSHEKAVLRHRDVQYLLFEGELARHPDGRERTISLVNGQLEGSKSTSSSFAFLSVLGCLADTKSKEYQTTSRIYRRLGKALAFAVHAEHPTLALHILRATRRLVESPPVDYPLMPRVAGRLPGKVMRLDDKNTLDNTLNGLIADELLKHSRRMHAGMTSANAGMLQHIPHVAHLLSAQDKMGRTAWHMLGKCYHHYHDDRNANTAAHYKQSVTL